MVGREGGMTGRLVVEVEERRGGKEKRRREGEGRGVHGGGDGGAW